MVEKTGGSTWEKPALNPKSLGTSFRGDWNDVSTRHSGFIFLNQDF